MAPRAHANERVVVGLSTAAALVVLRLVNTQIYTEPWTIDPWFYTALMTNFDFIYHHFAGTYYASRLPAILPGYFLNSFLTPQHAYVVLHLVFFLAGALFLYLLVRTLFGVRVAVLLYPAFLTNAIYVDAHTWDYVDGFVITYLSGGLYFLASCIGRRSRARPALAGFFFAAAAMTNIFATLLVLAVVVAYLVVRWATDRRSALARVGVEAAWFVTGAGVLLVACGVFSRQHGGRFLFFMPSIEALRTINQAAYQANSYAWLRDEPRLLVPVFLAVLVAVAWRRRQRPEGERFGLALTVAATVVVLVLALYEFLGSGYFLQVSYYFDLLFPFFFIMLAAAVFILLGCSSRDAVTSFAALAGIGLVVGAAPLVIVFGIESTQLWGRGGAKIVVALMAVTLSLGLVLRLRLARGLTPALALVVAALAIGSVGYASAANVSTYGKFANRGLLTEAGDVFSLGVELEHFMQRNGLQEGVLPAFWYDYSRDPSLISLVSLYYYPFVLISDEMPIPQVHLRAVLGALRPEHVVLVCVDPACDGSGAALRSAGYDPVLVAEERLHAGSKSVWVEAYRVSA